MATEKYTKPSDESFAIHEAAGSYGPELHLPEDPGFAPLPPRISLAQMMARSRQLRAWFPAGIPTPEERWQAKSTQEFRL